MVSIILRMSKRRNSLTCLFVRCMMAIRKSLTMTSRNSLRKTRSLSRKDQTLILPRTNNLMLIGWRNMDMTMGLCLVSLMAYCVMRRLLVRWMRMQRWKLHNNTFRTKAWRKTSIHGKKNSMTAIMWRRLSLLDISQMAIVSICLTLWRMPWR